jgi:hypothetical protein
VLAHMAYFLLLLELLFEGLQEQVVLRFLCLDVPTKRVISGGRTTYSGGMNTVYKGAQRYRSCIMQICASTCASSS